MHPLSNHRTDAERLNLPVMARLEVPLDDASPLRNVFSANGWTLDDAFTTCDGIAVLWAGAGVTELYKKGESLIALDLV